MKHFERINTGLKLGLSAAILMGSLALQAQTDSVPWPGRPLGASISAKPLTMLVASRDHKLFYEAYNDASDVNQDGILDTRFKPEITYTGLYDSTLCYNYVTDSDANKAMFRPVATALTNGVCRITSGSGGAASETKYWSGNWLNYVTTSRMDVLRKVLYGGHRDVDTSTQTVLRRAYIPQDAHSWGKEYHSGHGYRIGDYTPLAEPTSTSHRHFFGNLTANASTNCSTLDNCSNLPPLLRVRTNVGENKRIWEWSSKERPVLDGSLSSGSFPSGTGAEQNFTVRVEVCTATYRAGCKGYGTSSKPVGLLHEYGESESMLFGLLTGSYDQHFSGGRLRKVVSSFRNEVNTSTGQFNSGATIVNTFNNIRIRGFNQSSSSGEYKESNPYEKSARAPSEGDFVDWGNPVGEMLYEATRYFAGKKSATSAFNTGTTQDSAVGLSSASWDDPYESGSAASASFCARANFLTISDTNPSFDSDQLPGSAFSSALSGDLTGLNVKTGGDQITDTDDSPVIGVSTITGMRFIGQSGTGSGSYDAAPTAKNVTSLGTIRGLAPEEPTKQGSYYAASVARYAKITDLRTSEGFEGKQSVDNYVVALNSPLPRIEAKLPNGKVINVIPFAKTVSGSGVSASKGSYQPTNQIVDFFVESLANSDANNQDATINGGRYQAEFLINFEDVEQGGDHDMDAIARYTVKANADNTLSVTVTPTYQAGGMQQHMGYVISGTTRDGVYLVARDETTSPNYFLNVPAGGKPGDCDTASPPAGCALPSIGNTPAVFTFTPGSAAATLLKDPLWYAAKWGGFADRDNSQSPNLQQEWDANGDGVPDTYFLVQNPLQLRESLKKAFNSIIEKSGSGGNIIANSTVLSTDSLVFQATFNSARWSGNLLAYPVSALGVGSVSAWDAASRIPAPASRNIITSKIANNGSLAGRAFTWNDFTTTEQASFFNSNQNLLDYLRGVRTREVQNGGTLRNRLVGTVLGDISHSSPSYIKEGTTEVVYVGANDGMLHAFNAKTGVELFGYIPSSVLGRLKNLTSTAFEENHEYFVDGDIAVSSKAQTGNTNYLVATLGRGGKGLFGLDVTRPGSFANNHVLWERFDGASDTDLGYMLGRPVIAKTNNNVWVALVGNGYSSASGRAALYVVQLSNGTVIKKIQVPASVSTLVMTDNGLATPGPFDSDNNGTVDFAYAGDLYGNVWKFDLSSNNPASWGLANSGAPLFQAKDKDGLPQPITAPLSVAVNDVSTDPNYAKRFVFFGTGSYFKTGDPANTDTQTWYSIIDDNLTVAGRNALTERTITETALLNGTPARAFSTASAGDMSGQRGCYIDLPATGERIVSTSRLFNLAEPTLLASSIIPVVDQCTPGGNGYLNAVNPFTCARLTAPFFDLNNDAQFGNDTINGAYIGSVDLGVGMPGEAILVGNRLAIGGSKGVVKDIRVNTGAALLRGRISWREIVRD